MSTYHAEDADGGQIMLRMKPDSGEPFIVATHFCINPDFHHAKRPHAYVDLSAVLDVLRQAGFTVTWPEGEGS